MLFASDLPDSRMKYSFESWLQSNKIIRRIGFKNITVKKLFTTFNGETENLRLRATNTLVNTMPFHTLRHTNTLRKPAANACCRLNLRIISSKGLLRSLCIETNVPYIRIDRIELVSSSSSGRSNSNQWQLILVAFLFFETLTFPRLDICSNLTSF